MDLWRGFITRNAHMVHIVNKIRFKVTADRRGDNSNMLYRSRNGEVQIIRFDDTQINIKTLSDDKIK